MITALFGTRETRVVAKGIQQAYPRPDVEYMRVAINILEICNFTGMAVDLVWGGSMMLRVGLSAWSDVIADELALYDIRIMPKNSHPAQEIHCLRGTYD